MKILAIETSCDETAVALVACTESETGTKVTVISEQLYSQAKTHTAYGGVYPTVAKREHQKILPDMVRNVLQDAGALYDDQAVHLTPEIEHICEREPSMLETIKDSFSQKNVRDIDAIAVTQGPGLAPALWVGINCARILSALWNIPIIPTNHMEGHIYSALLTDAGYCTQPKYPMLSLLVSGGHTELVVTSDTGDHQKIGSTRDDAAGEAFDKVARLLGLPYPGGPEISKLAQKARQENYTSPTTLPRPMIQDESLHFSYAGLKTAVRVFLEKNPTLTEQEKSALAMEFENAVTETLLKKTQRAIEQYNPKTLILGGGVSANRHLRECFTKALETYPAITLYLAQQKRATDNAVMIALAAYANRNTHADTATLTAAPNLSFPPIKT